MADIVRAHAVEQLRDALLPSGMHLNGDKKPPITGSFLLNMPDVDACLQGGLAINALHEVRCELARDAGSIIGFVLGLLSILSERSSGRVAWVCDPAVRLENGSLFPHALARFGIDPERFVIIQPVDFKGAMWAADEAAKCHDLMACVLHVRGNPSAFDLTATRRLMLRARHSGVFTCLLRQSGREEASAAATRWRIASAPASVLPHFAGGIGNARFTLALERNRSGHPGQWTAAWNHHKKSFGDVSATITKDTVSSSASSTGRPHRPAEMGQVVAFKRTA